jgi:putative two-component system response regulator
MAECIARYHHERWDGAGYCAGLEGDEIPLPARIVAAADSFDALTHERPYKRAWSRDEAMAEIEQQSGRQFDPRVVRTLRILVSNGTVTVDPRDGLLVGDQHFSYPVVGDSLTLWMA